MIHHRPFRWSRTVTLSSIGASSTLGSTHLTGTLQSLYLSISKAAGAASKVTITTSSTQRLLFKIADPSTLGAFYRPKALDSGTTGDALATRNAILLCDNRIRIKVASSSGLAGGTVTVNTILS